MTAMSAFARDNAAWLIADTGHYYGDGVFTPLEKRL